MLIAVLFTLLGFAFAISLGLLGAWSADRDPKGLNVRAEASMQARVLGTLPPPYRLKTGGSENIPEGGWLCFPSEHDSSERPLRVLVV